MSRLKIFSLVLGLFFLQTVAQASVDHTYVSCSGHTGVYDVSFKNRFYLNKKLLNPNKPQSDQIQEAINQQLNYFFGFYVNQDHRKMSFVPSSEKPKVISVVTKDALYPVSMKIDNPVTSPNPIEQEYVKSAIAQGSVSKGEAALLVEAEIQIQGVLCDSLQSPRKSLSFVLPFDPFLFYWAVDEKNRHPFHWGVSDGVSNPCASSEVVDFPDPQYFWYFSRPEYRGTDKNGVAFDCQKLLQEGTHYTAVSGKLKLKSQVSHKQKPFQIENLKSKPVLKGTFIYGRMEETKPGFPQAELVKRLEGKNEIGREEFLKTLSESGLPPEQFDRGGEQALYFFQHIGDLVEDEKYSGELVAGAPTVRIQGKLRHSQKSVDLHFYYGATDIFQKIPTEHWGLVTHAFQNDDLVFYNGHSGLGENLKLANIIEKAKLTPENVKNLFQKAPAYQLLAYFSCYSYSYFGTETILERKLHQPRSETDAIFTGSSLTDEKTPLGVLDFLDQSLVGMSRLPSGLANSRFLKPQDVLIFESFKSNPKTSRRL